MLQQSRSPIVNIIATFSPWHPDKGTPLHVAWVQAGVEIFKSKQSRDSRFPEFALDMRW